MAADWQIVAFPLILPWRDEFWTLPLYFPDLKVGVAPGWPEQLPYPRMPLPPEAEIRPQELKHYQPGDFHQWQAFQTYQEAHSEGDDLLGKIRQYGQPEPSHKKEDFPHAWSLAWQLEKLQADQEAQLGLVERGQGWLKDILTPEPWEERPDYASAPGLQEMVDPDLAQLRYRLWRRVMAPHLKDPWAPLLLGRTSRSLFLTLKGWPEWTGLKKVQISLPGCRTREEWSLVCGNGTAPPWQAEARERLEALLAAVDDPQELEAAAGELAEFVANTVAAQWPFPVAGNFDLEVWLPGSEEEGPVLCWAGAAQNGLLPGS
jgi:hypothetical protein